MPDFDAVEPNSPAPAVTFMPGSVSIFSQAHRSGQAQRIVPEKAPRLNRRVASFLAIIQVIARAAKRKWNMEVPYTERRIRP